MRRAVLPLLLGVACTPPEEPCPPIVVVPSGEVRLAVGATAERRAIDVDSGEPVEDVAWRSDDGELLTVLDEGGVAGKKAGVTSLIAERDCGAVASAPVRVLDRISIDPAEPVTLEVGQTATLAAKGGDGTVLTAASRWSGPHGTVARVDDAGTVSAVGPGRTTIRAEWQGLTAEVEVEVTEPAERPEGHIAWQVGAYAPTQAEFRPGTADDPAVSALGSCGQGTDNHVWLSALVPAATGADYKQTFGWATITARILAPEPGPVRDWRAHVVLDPGAEADTLFGPAIEWHTPDYAPEAWHGRTVEFQITLDNPDYLPSEPGVVLIDNRITNDNNCCDPGAC